MVFLVQVFKLHVRDSFLFRADRAGHVLRLVPRRPTPPEGGEVGGDTARREGVHGWLLVSPIRAFWSKRRNGGTVDLQGFAHNFRSRLAARKTGFWRNGAPVSPLVKLRVIVFSAHFRPLKWLQVVR